MPELPHWTVKDCPCYHRYMLTCWKHLLTILQCVNNPARLLISWVALSRDSPNDTICNKPADNRSSKEIVADPLVPCNFLPRQFLQCNEPVRVKHDVMLNFSWCENELMKDIFGSSIEYLSLLGGPPWQSNFTRSSRSWLSEVRICHLYLEICWFDH